MTKILHVFQSLAGGTGTYLNNIAQHQIENFGEENVFFVLPESDKAFFSNLNTKNVLTFRSSKRTLASLLNFYSVAGKAMRQSRADIIHLHSTFAGLLRLVRPHRRVVYCPHGWSFARDDGWLLTTLFALTERFLAWKAEAIICISEHERNAAITRCLPESKLRLIRNGVADRFFPRDTGKQSISIAFIGRFDRQKGADILLREFSRVKRTDIRLTVVGGHVLADSVIDEGICDERVSFVGWLQGAEVPELLSGIDALIIPSRWEGFGLVAIEAMRAGCAVICSNRGALPEIVGPKEGYIFDLEQSGQLAGIIEGLEKRDLVQKGNEARNKFLQEFEARFMNERICDLYREMAQ